MSAFNECLRVTQRKFAYSPLWKTVFALLELLKIFFSECLRVTHWSFCFSKSMSAANTLSMLLTLLLLLKRHERSECHSLWFCLWFCLWFSFYSFKKLLKAFRPPSSPRIARLSDFKKLLLPNLKLLLPNFLTLKQYFCQTLKLLLPNFKLQCICCCFIKKLQKS